MERFKHSAIANMPFNIEIFADLLSPQAVFQNLKIEDENYRTIITINIMPIKDNRKNMFYIPNIIIEKPGNYFDYWYFKDGLKNITLKSYFTVKSGTILTPNYYFYAKIYNIDLIKNNRLHLTIKTNDPYFTIESENEIKIIDQDNKNIEIDWIHEIGPKQWTIQTKSTINAKILNIFIDAKGFYNIYKLNKTLLLS